MMTDAFLNQLSQAYTLYSIYSVAPKRPAPKRLCATTDRRQTAGAKPAAPKRHVPGQIVVAMLAGVCSEVNFSDELTEGRHATIVLRIVLYSSIYIAPLNSHRQT